MRLTPKVTAAFNIHCILITIIGISLAFGDRSSGKKEIPYTNTCDLVTNGSRCILISNGLNWFEAHKFCRNKGGFLPNANDLRNGVPDWLEETWTALKCVQGRYVFLSRKVEYARYIAWESLNDLKSPCDSSSCSISSLKTEKFSRSECLKKKSFFCIVDKSLEGEIDWDTELHVIANLEDNSGWTKVSKNNFSDLILTCSARKSTTADVLTHPLSQTWSKDGIWLDYTNLTIIVANSSNLHFPIESPAEDIFENSLIGIYCCDTWSRYSTNRTKSNCILVTQYNVSTLAITEVIGSEYSSNNLEDIPSYKCPKGYKITKGPVCVKIIKNVSWQDGFSKMYKTGNEKTLFDGIKYLIPYATNVSIHNRLLNYLTEENIINVWLPLKRKYPHTAFIDHSIDYTHEDTQLASRNTSAFSEVEWALGQPLSGKMCVYYNTIRRAMFSDDCNKTYNFVVFIDIATLEKEQKILDNDGEELGLCEEDWFRVGISETKQICTRAFHQERYRSWKDADDFCLSQNAQLAFPGLGFTDWTYRGFLRDNETSWIRITKDKFYSSEYSFDFLNWLPGTDFRKKYGILNNKGWTMVDEDKRVMHSVICERHISVKSRLRILLERKQVETENGKINSLCLLTEPEYLLRNNSITCLKDGTVIQRSCSVWENCQCLIYLKEQGDYICSAWSKFPVQQVWSPSFQYIDNTSVSYVILATQSNYVYNPFYNDPAFDHPKLRRKFEPSCMNSIFKKITKNTEGRFNNFTNLIMSNDNGKFIFSFHLLCREPYLSICSSAEQIKNELNNLLSTDSSASKVCSVIEVRNPVGCLKDNQYSGKELLSWSATFGAGIFIPKELCILDNGLPMSRVCEGSFKSGYYWNPPLSGGCPYAPSEKTKKLWKIYSEPEEYIKKSFPKISQLTNESTNLIAADIVYVASIMKSLVAVPEIYEILTYEDIGQIMNNMLGANTTIFSSTYETFNTSSSLLETSEQLSFLTSKNITNKFNQSYLEMVSVSNINFSEISSTIGYQWSALTGFNLLSDSDTIDKKHLDVAVLLPKNLSENIMHDLTKTEHSLPSSLQLSFTLYKSTNLFIDPEYFYSEHKIQSQVIQASYQNIKINKDILNGEGVKIFFRPKHRGYDAKCVYWDFQKNGNKGGWSGDGCHLHGFEHNLATCECDNLSHFALLIQGLPISPIHMYTLSLLSIIGCSLSIFGLFTVLLTFVLFEPFRKTLDNKILASLSLSMSISIIMLLYVLPTPILYSLNELQGISVGEIVSVVVAIYFVLASFGWMLIESLHHYFKFVKVYGTYVPRFILKASIFAWGMPIIPIIVAFIVQRVLQDTRLTFLYVFIPPIALILVINAVTYIMIVNSAIQCKSTLNSTQDQRQRIINQVSMAICVFFLLGFTWIFGFVFLFEPSLFFGYSFGLCNTTPGFLIFFFHICRSKNVRSMWLNYIKAFGNRSTKLDKTNLTGDIPMPYDSKKSDSSGTISSECSPI